MNGSAMFQPLALADHAAEPGIAAALLALGLGDAALRQAPGPGPIASPMHRAVSSHCLLLDSGPGSPVCFVKLLHADMQGWVDLDLSVHAARQAASQGLAPAVLAYAPRQRCVAFQHLAEGWTPARLSELARPALLQQVLALKASLHRQPLLGQRFDPFERIVSLAAQARQAGAPLPGDITWLLAQAEAMRQALAAAGQEICPCHNEGSASNLMLGPGGALMLVDFDQAGDGDPWYDFASTLVEACAFDDEWSAALEQFNGRVDPRLLSRARLHGVASDLMWGLWGCLYAVASPRQGVEFFKYGQWRLLRCRQAMSAWNFEFWLRSL